MIEEKELTSEELANIFGSALFYYLNEGEGLCVSLGDDTFIIHRDGDELLVTQNPDTSTQEGDKILFN